jgi:FkbM family methyltransferase
MARLGAAVQNVAVSTYAILAKLGVTNAPPVRNAFLRLYRAYKTVEMGPVAGLRAYVSPGDAVIDVGANIGMFTEMFARWVGPDGKVVAIEPEELNFATLVDNARKGEFGGSIKPVLALCADTPGQLFLERNIEQPTDHKIAVDGAGIPVDATTVDEQTGALDDRRVALIKIDVQGAELLVLQGAEQTLRKHAPVLFIEIHEKSLNRFGVGWRDIHAFLSARGYAMHRLRRDGAAPFSSEQLEHALADEPYIDVLFLHESAPVTGG